MLLVPNISYFFTVKEQIRCWDEVTLIMKTVGVQNAPQSIPHFP